MRSLSSMRRCPLVSKVHNEGNRYVGQKRTVILIGHAGHPEVEGTLGQIDGPVRWSRTRRKSKPSIFRPTRS